VAHLRRLRARELWTGSTERVLSAGYMLQFPHAPIPRTCPITLGPFPDSMLALSSCASLTLENVPHAE